MKKLKLCSLVVMACLLIACGPTKKNQQNKDGTDGLGHTGQGQQDGSDGGTNNPPPRVPTFAEYCAKHPGGHLINNICVYRFNTVTITPPANFPTIYSVDVAPAWGAMVVQTTGDASGAANLFTRGDHDVVTPFMPINDKVNRKRVNNIFVILQLIATEKFTTPAEIKIFRCENPQHGAAECPPF